MFTRALQRTRNSRGRLIAPLGVALALIAAPMALLPSAASADSGSTLSGSPFNGGDGSLDSSPALSVTPDNPSGNFDNSYTQGAKENDLCPAVDSGSIPPSKADLSNLYVGTAKGSNDHTFLYLGWSRTDTNGTVTLDFELNQATQSLGTCHNGVNPARTAGDVLVTYDFQGGQVDALQYRLWTGTKWGDPHDILTSGYAEGSINLDTLKFGEMAIDLEGAGIFTPGVCMNLASELVKSRSSDSFTAEMKDFIGPGRTAISNCGSLQVTKTVVGGSASDSFGFTATCGDVSLTGADASFSLLNGGSHTIADLPLGTNCSVTETDPGATSWSTAYTVGGGSSHAGRTAASGAITLGTRTIAFTNTRLTGDLVVSKTTTGGTGTFTFHVDCDGSAYDQNVTITGSGSQTITGIPTGTSCTVDEVADPLFTSTRTPADGTVTLDNDGETVAFTNTAKPNGISIDKKVNGLDTTSLKPLEVEVGSSLNYSVVVTNSGQVPLSISALSDSLNAGIGATCVPAVATMLDPGESVTCSYTTTAADPGGNSIVRNTATASGLDLFERTAGPVSDGTYVHVLDPAVHLVKTAPASAHVGDEITYILTVTNPGNTPLAITGWVDDVCSATPTLTSRQGGDSLLDPGETWVYGCSHVVGEGDPGPLVNIATVTGADQLETSVHSTDRAPTDILKPAISVTKSATPRVHVGDTVLYTMVVTNTGDAPLSSVHLTDPKCDSPATSSDADGTLSPEESWTYTCNHVATDVDGDQILNRVDVSGADALQKVVTSFAIATTDILKPAIAIAKTGPASVHVGDAVVYTIVVTNPGNTPLASVTVSDPKCDGLPVRSTTDADGLLSPGEAWMYHCSHVATAADGVSILNTAKAEGTDPLGQTVNNTANHTAVVLHPAISIDKTADPESVGTSGPVTYRYVVKNTGDATLHDVLVTDDIIGAIGQVASLDPGESATLTKTVIVDASTPPTNIGTVVGTDILGETVTAHDSATITVVLGAVITRPEPQSELPRTGAPLQTETRAALALIEVGVILELSGRRRRWTGRRVD